MGSEEAQAPVQPGDVVAGKYRIERIIGSGGVGLVVAARHLTLGEPVALKFLLTHHSESRDVVERLLREARATFRLRSVHTVRVHDVGELPTGPLYIVMELLEGRDLRAELQARGPLPVNEVVTHMLDACLGLHEAHSLGIVHRDLKPGNLFLAKAPAGRDIVKVVDFGMSKLDPALYEAGPLTRPETALGTPRYMAPEQWKEASTVDPTADIWALGVVMYELLTGKAPLQGMLAGERQARLLAGAIPSPRDVRGDVPEELARVILRCLRADPRARWGSAAHLARAIRGAVPPTTPAESEPVTSTGVTAVVPPTEQARRAAQAFDEASDPRSHPSPPTRRETPEARAQPGPSGLAPALPCPPFPRTDDLEEMTEVRAPVFTPADYVVQSGDAPIAKAPKKMAATLRSIEAPPEITEPEPQEKTLPLAPMPRPPAVGPSNPPPALAAPPGHAPMTQALPRTLALPPAWRPSPVANAPRATPVRRSRTTVYVLVAGVAALVVAGLLAFLVVRLL